MKAGNLAICVVFYNKAEVTSRCIASFASAGWPIHVLDNGSEAAAANEVASLCERYDNVILHHSAKNLGPAGGRNHLIAATRESNLLFVDNDVVVEQADWARKIEHHLPRLETCDALVATIRNSWDNSYIRPASLHIENGSAVYRTIDGDRSNLFPGGGTIVSRRVFDALGYYDEGLWSFEEADLALRAIKRERPLDVRFMYDVELVHYHQFLPDPVDQQAVKLRYSRERIGHAQRQIEERYGIQFNRDFARWANQQVRDHTICPGQRKVERGLLMLASRLKAVVAGRRRL